MNKSREQMSKIYETVSRPVLEYESESEIFIRSYSRPLETSAKTISGRCRRGNLEK